MPPTSTSTGFSSSARLSRAHACPESDRGLMVGFRVAKYPPRSPGRLAVEEWTSVSDIGKPLATPLTLARYLQVEDAYVETVRRFMAQGRVQSLGVRDLELNDCESLPAELTSQSEARLPAMTEGAELSGEDLEWAVRLTLREVVWCRLKGTAGFYVHFGYDYYMYVGAELPGFTPPSLPEGMYLEPFNSPYLADSD